MASFTSQKQLVCYVVVFFAEKFEMDGIKKSIDQSFPTAEVKKVYF